MRIGGGQLYLLQLVIVMPTLRDLQSEVAKKADTAKSKITVATVSRVLKVLKEVVLENPELGAVVKRSLGLK